MGAAMPYYGVQSRATAGQMQTYWIEAESVEQTRTLVALNVPAAANARDTTLFDCLVGDTKRLPEGVIYRGSEGPLPSRASKANSFWNLVPRHACQASSISQSA
jgi:hypothetical protein